MPQGQVSTRCIATWKFSLETNLSTSGIIGLAVTFSNMVLSNFHSVWSWNIWNAWSAWTFWVLCRWTAESREPNISVKRSKPHVSGLGKLHITNVVYMGNCSCSSKPLLNIFNAKKATFHSKTFMYCKDSFSDHPPWVHLSKGIYTVPQPRCKASELNSMSGLILWTG